MISFESLRPRIMGINGKDYGAYQSLKGSYDCRDFELYIDRIPKDPYAPSFTGIYRVRIKPSYCYIPEDLLSNSIRNTAYRDYLARCFFRESSRCSSHRGTGNSGLITIDEPGQAILNRNSVILTENFIELRFFIGLPADGRLIKGELAQTMLFGELPDVVEKAFKRENFNSGICEKHLKTAQRAEYLRKQLKKGKLVSFIANGSLLPRKSGMSEQPMKSEKAITFTSPPTLEITFEMPDGESVSGMGIPEGITLITGGGYHGKTTLLQAVSSGIYNHIAGDGRELAVTSGNALKLRAYSGRFVEKVDISPFIGDLPSGDDTSVFSTENASGSTSQAATLMEGLEAGVPVILMDEDTCASNFMIRDFAMQQLVRKTDEPITPFIDRARQLFTGKSVSSILVLGGSGDYFGISDTVIQMKGYTPYDVTENARQIAQSDTYNRINESRACHFDLKKRIPLPGSIDPENRYGKRSVYAKEVYRINFGRYIIDLTDVEQLTELSQTKAVMEALQRINTFIDGKRSLMEILTLLKEEIESRGLDCLSDRMSGNLAEFRMIDLASTINRLRSLKIL